MKSGQENSEQPKAQIMEWKVCDDEREWQKAQDELLEQRTSAILPRWKDSAWVMRWGVTCLCVLIALIACLWFQAQQGLKQIETELRAAVDAEPWLETGTGMCQPSDTTDNLRAQRAHESVQLRLRAESGELVTKLEVIDMGHDWAVVQVIVQTPNKTTAYRQTRIYKQMACGWVHVAPSAEYWGQLHQLESDYFVIHYFMQDAAAVQQFADKLDDLYTSIYAVFFAERPTGAKLVVHIDPTQPGVATMRMLHEPHQALVIASPAATLAPIEMHAADVLAQSLTLALFERVSNQAAERYHLPPQWWPLRDGLRLWFIWHQELPLARWHKPVVKWVFWDQETVSPPVNQRALAYPVCASHALWMYDPLEIGVPIRSWRSSEAEELVSIWRYPYPLSFKLPLPLTVDVPLREQEYAFRGVPLREPNAAAPVAIATVIEYATTTFGTSRLPTLLAALSRHESWETLIPAVFDVSLAEFTAGWSTFLAQQYGISR